MPRPCMAIVSPKAFGLRSARRRYWCQPGCCRLEISRYRQCQWRGRRLSERASLRLTTQSIAVSAKLFVCRTISFPLMVCIGSLVRQFPIYPQEPGFKFPVPTNPDTSANQRKKQENGLAARPITDLPCPGFSIQRAWIGALFVFAEQGML